MQHFRRHQSRYRLPPHNATLTPRTATCKGTHLGLKPPLEHLLGGELKHEVEFPLIFAEETKADHTAEKGGALKQTLGVLSVKGQQLTSSLRKTKGRDKNKVDDIYLFLVSKSTGIALCI